VREFSYIRGALPPARLGPMCDGLLRSPLVSKSTLGGTFAQSRGFAMVFKAKGRTEIEERFPVLKDYFAQVLGEPAVRAVQSWWGRFRRHPVRVPNAWYLNLLLVAEGANVGPHTDATLAKPAGVPAATPEVVTVLYLRVPAGGGGKLVLARGGKIKGVVSPSPGGLLHFRGDLPHEVRPVPGGVERASLVIEQYRFEDEALARLPDFKLDSRAGFGAYLEHHRERGAKQLEIER
jgi:hypothetical protein